jgi:hypothetical protein
MISSNSVSPRSKDTEMYVQREEVSLLQEVVVSRGIFG